jgi:hypothetical protein
VPAWLPGRHHQNKQTMKEAFEARKLDGEINIKLSAGRRWSADKATVCSQIITIVERYAALGYRLTLRQLYYQLVAADYIPNHDKVYSKLSSILDDLRYSGKVDWAAIEDRGRVPYLPYWVHSIKDALDDTASHYRLNRQQGQDTVIEVWTEKDAISGILKRITTKFHVNLVVNKGYSSSSAMHKAYQRFAGYINEGKKVIVLYFGDHDPSGLDMVRDIYSRIMFFLAAGDLLDTDDGTLIGGKIIEWWLDNDLQAMPDEWLAAAEYVIAYNNGEKSSYTKFAKCMLEYNRLKNQQFIIENNLFVVQPIGLTMEQIEDFNPPPNPAKLTDPRAKWYVEQFGDISWEVDAIEPTAMEKIVEDAILEIIDEQQYQGVLSREKRERNFILNVAKKYDNEEE